MSRMEREILLQKKFCMNFFVRFFFLMAIVSFSGAYPSVQEDEFEREYPAIHQLTSWLISQVRKGEFASPDVPVIPYRIQNSGKRNSAELSSSIMGIPRTMIDNGRKK